MAQTSGDYNRPLQSAVDLSDNLNQQTYMISGQLGAQEEDVSISVEVNCGDTDGQS